MLAYFIIAGIVILWFVIAVKFGTWPKHYEPEEQE